MLHRLYYPEVVKEKLFLLILDSVDNHFCDCIENRNFYFVLWPNRLVISLALWALESFEHGS